MIEIVIVTVGVNSDSSHVDACKKLIGVIFKGSSKHYFQTSRIIDGEQDGKLQLPNVDFVTL